MTLPSSLKKFLWDVEPSELNSTTHRAFIITRLAEKGDWTAVRWLKKHYGIPTIKRIVAGSKNTSVKTKSFWKIA